MFLLTARDVIKTVLQVQHSMHSHAAQIPKYNGLLGSAKTIWREEGLRGLYRGLGTTTLVWFITVYIFRLSCRIGLFTFFHTVHPNMLQKIWVQRMIIVTPKGFEEGPLVHIASAVNAAIITDIFVNPLWMIKTRLQVSFNRFLNRIDAKD